MTVGPDFTSGGCPPPGARDGQARTIPVESRRDKASVNMFARPPCPGGSFRVLLRPTRTGGGRGYRITGHHELMIPLLPWSVEEYLGDLQGGR